MVVRQLAASAKNLVTARQRESATRIRETETEKRTGIRTRIATATANEKGIRTGTGTGTEITMSVIATVTVTVTAIGTGNGNGNGNGIAIATVTVTATVKGRETVVPGTTVGMMTIHDGHRVTMAAIVNGIGRATRPENVVTETETSMPHEDQVREGRTENGVQEGMERMTEAATMSHERSVRRRAMSEVRKCVGSSFLNLNFSNAHA
jgi:hypothetical protein